MSAAPKFASANELAARSLRKDAEALRLIASELLGAELAADWVAVARLRGSLVESAHELEALALKHAPAWRGFTPEELAAVEREKTA